MDRIVIGAFAFVAMAGIGCASAESPQRSSLRFAVAEPHGRCMSEGSPRTIASDVREPDLEATASNDGFAVRFTQKAKTHVIGAVTFPAVTASATMDEEWVNVDGARLWRVTRPVQWIRAVRAGEHIAVAMVSDGKLLAGVAGSGILRGPVQTLGAVTVDDSPPDLVMSAGNAAITWEGPDGSYVAGFTTEGWSVRTIPTPPEAHVMDPRIAAVGGRFIVLWREGTLERHGLRAQLYNASARPVGATFDPAPGLEVVRADIAAKPSGEVLVASLVATEKGLDLVTSPVLCNAE
jgi:hypothetical protein